MRRVKLYELTAFDDTNDIVTEYHTSKEEAVAASKCEPPIDVVSIDKVTVTMPTTRRELCEMLNGGGYVLHREPVIR